MLQTFDFTRTSGSNPFADLLANALAERVTVLPFRWWRSILGRYDVLHVHWPEYLYGGGTRLKSAVKSLLTLLLVVRIRATRVAIVRTVHNSDPHESDGKFESWLARQLDALTTAYVVMNPDTQLPTDAPSRYIPHGHYRDWYATALDSRGSRERGQILYFGLIRRYKGVESLIRAFSSTDREDWKLRIIGKPIDSALADELRVAANADPRASMDLRFIDEDSLTADIMRSSLVVLPYAGLNSGSIILALSLGRPVLTRAGSNATNLQREFGADWIRTFDAELSALELRDAVEWADGVSEGALADMSSREWGVIGEAHADLYRWARLRAKGHAPR